MGVWGWGVADQDRKDGEPECAEGPLGAIMDCMDEAVLATDLDGVITSFNKGAERLFGYAASEALGEPLTILIPNERREAEADRLRQVLAGESFANIDGVCRHKGEQLVEIGFSLSPLRSSAGQVFGAVCVARDITKRRRGQDQQTLMLKEMDHRIKNLFAITGSVVALSARASKTPAELASAVQGRLGALARAHALTVRAISATDRAAATTSVHTLLKAITAPYEHSLADGGTRITVTGADATITGAALANFALLLHEIATNAAKYGALFSPSGHIDVVCSEQGDHLHILWTELNGPPLTHPATKEGFGSIMARATVAGQLGGEITRDWRPEGLVIRLSVLRDRLLTYTR